MRSGKTPAEYENKLTYDDKKITKGKLFIINPLYDIFYLRYFFGGASSFMLLNSQMDIFNVQLVKL